jgi:hypothetical protein
VDAQQAAMAAHDRDVETLAGDLGDGICSRLIRRLYRLFSRAVVKSELLMVVSIVSVRNEQD